MNPSTRKRLSGPFPAAVQLVAELSRLLQGEVRADALTRTIYATDAGLYEIPPTAVVAPRHMDDIVTTVNACRRFEIPIIPRGAGTGLAGGAVGGGVCLDCSKYLRNIEPVDLERRTIRVQAGVVLDELNAFLLPHGLHFAPDVATGSRATLGGMIANNSCGAHSVIYRRTVDHVCQLTVALADGSVARWGNDIGRGESEANPTAQRIERELARIVKDHRNEIAARYPKVLRTNGGYGLDRLLETEPIDPCQLICGSEGTLGIVVEAELNLVPLPKHKALVVVHFEQLLDSLAATPLILQHHPAAVELVDKLILDAAARNPAMARRRQFLVGDPAAILIVEFFADDPDELIRQLDSLETELRQSGLGYASVRLTDRKAQADVWEIRKSGLGLLMSRPGDHKAYEFIEDAAVDPSRLRDYIERLTSLLAEEGVREAGYYAHASVGCLHVRPVLNLRRSEDVERLYRIGDKVSDLVLEFGGSMSGEHGDGLVRSCWIEKMYGPQLVRAFAEVKAVFDPENLFNPGKIVDPPRMNENLRTDPTLVTLNVATNLDFSDHGGMAGLAGMCTGVGQCRQRLVGTMCPSYMATGEEMHTTRARANALRSAMSNRGLINGLSDPQLDEVMDLCLSCKACKTECPTGVDMARLKAEWQSHKNLREGVSRRSRLIADTPYLAHWGSRFAPVSNWVMQSGLVRGWIERLYGLSAKVPPPKFARQTFRQWWRRHVRMRNAECGVRNGNENSRGRVVYFLDTWTNHYTPDVGIAAVRLLEAAGYRVLVPYVHCCGRPMISKGLLTEARHLAAMNVTILSPFVEQGIPIVGSEPSCILTFVDEAPQLTRTLEARTLAESTFTVETFLARLLESEPNAIPFTHTTRRILYHGHCHEKAMLGTQDAMRLLNAPPGFEATEINSGCCGMAGSFGHEVEHVDVARLIGEQRLFPAIRNRGDAAIAVSGFSCRHQIGHSTNVSVRHLLDLLLDAL